MTGRPLIGVTGRRKRGDQLVGNIAILADFAVDVFYADYGRGVLEAGGVPVFLPIDVDPVDFMDHLDGVLLTGGADIDQPGTATSRRPMPSHRSRCATTTSVPSCRRPSTSRCRR